MTMRKPSRSADEPAPDASDRTFGTNVKALRLRRGLTLDRLAEETGLSKSHLSRFERGEKTLSIAALLRVSQALGSSVASLLGQAAGRSTYHLVRSAQRTARSVSDADGLYGYSVLGRDGEASALSAFVVDLPPDGSRAGRAEHGGEEGMFVLAGSVEVELEDERLTLAEGDYLQFSGTIRHRIRSLAGASRVLVVVAGK